MISKSDKEVYVKKLNMLAFNNNMWLALQQKISR